MITITYRLAGKVFKSFALTSFLLFMSLSKVVAKSDLPPAPRKPVYKVKRLKSPMDIDANWKKKAWKKANTIDLKHFIIKKPALFPQVKAKMLYTDEDLYVIFNVKDQYVKSLTTEINGPVWTDSAVEFFFSPNIDQANKFFNLEINAGGTVLLGYLDKKPSLADIRKITVAHTLPELIDPEITKPITSSLEFKIPLSMLQSYSNVTMPQKGVSWKANFYKIAEITSNPHYISWTAITHPKPNFHMPDFFGTIKFQ